VRNPSRRRRLFLRLGAGIALANASIALSQPGKTAKRIAWYGGTGIDKRHVENFREELSLLGWTDGRNASVRLFDALAGGTAPRAQREEAQIAAISDWKPDVLVALTTNGALALKRATTNVPIVFLWVEDPIQSGLVANLSYPGGNVTGVLNSEGPLAIKRLQVTRELLPKVNRVAAVFSERNKAHFKTLLDEMQEASRQLGLELATVSLRTGGKVADMISSLNAHGAQVVLPVGSLHFGGKGSQSVTDILKDMLDYQNQSKVPFIDNSLDSVELGFCAALGEPELETYRRAARIGAKILNGARPSQLPVDQAMQVQFWINLKTAKAIGISIPPLLLARADRVVQ